MSEKPEELARKFHAAYEELAPKMGYTTRVDTREFNRDSLNGQLMIAVCERVLASLEPSAEREAGFAEGIEAAAKVCERRAERRQEENAIYEPDTGAIYYKGRDEDELNARDEEDQDCADALRALSQPRANGDANG